MKQWLDPFNIVHIIAKYYLLIIPLKYQTFFPNIISFSTKKNANNKFKVPFNSAGKREKDTYIVRECAK